MRLLLTWGLLVEENSSVRYWLCIFVPACVYILVAAHTPYSILTWQGFDDMLFINHAQSLAEGRWLGRFSELTLVKGPGYPFFLAINYWLGLPISISHALFYIAALAILSRVVLRLSESQLLAVMTFVVPLFDPRIIQDNRILRDAIYSGQSILIVAVLVYSLYGTRNKNMQRMLAALAGLLAGWFWLTREEGVWLVPGLFFIVLFAVFRNRHLVVKVNVFGPTLIAIAFFSAVQVVFGLGNLIAYDKFCGVDVGEKNFRAAIKAMESVRGGTQVPYVSVPRGVRVELYKISPAFSELEKFIDPAGSVSVFEAGGCGQYPSTCGDISSGFFLWALRDAASKAGYYDSPTRASAFFERIAIDVAKACESKRLNCEQTPIPFMPPFTSEQLRRIPASFRAVWQSMTTVGPQYLSSPWNVSGPEHTFERALSVLNQPTHYPMIGKSSNVELQGWYYNKAKGDSWFTIKVSDDFSKNLPFSLTRIASPDLVKSFGDKLASQQRFRLTSSCAEHCKITFSNDDSKPIPVSINTKERFFFQGVTTLAFDIVDSGGIAPENIRVKAAAHVVSLLHRIYAVLLPVLMIVGLLAFTSTCYLAIRSSECSVIFIIAGACWISIVARAAILVLVDISLFPAITVNYMQPNFSFSIIASILSISGIFSYLSKNRLFSSNDSGDSKNGNE